MATPAAPQPGLLTRLWGAIVGTTATAEATPAKKQAAAQLTASDTKNPAMVVNGVPTASLISWRSRLLQATGSSNGGIRTGDRPGYYR